MLKMIIDGKNLVLGRLGAYAAKKALQGENVDIINSEYVVVSGKKDIILEEYKHRLARGMPKTGPFVYRREDMFVKRSIRGMLSYKKEKGLNAYKRIKCHIGVPENLNGKKVENMEELNLNNSNISHYMTVKEICEAIGRNN